MSFGEFFRSITPLDSNSVSRSAFFAENSIIPQKCYASRRANMFSCARLYEVRYSYTSKSKQYVDKKNLKNLLISS